MSRHSHYFGSPSGCVTAVLPFALEALIGDWTSLRSPFVRNRPEEFSRGEWAYLIGELDPQRLDRYFSESFGPRISCPPNDVRVLFRPRGTVAVWLPNNVSLLGPLSTIALTLTGNRLLLKSGSGAANLTGTFLSSVMNHLRPGCLRSLLEDRVQHHRFDRHDPRNREWAEEADVRIVFGSDRAAAEIHGSASAKAAASISFTDRRSTVWMDPAACTDAVLISLIRVFTVYGTAGCSSPRSVVLLDATQEQCKRIRDRLLALWPEAAKEVAPPHLASANYLSWQMALAEGWDARLAPSNAAVLATGTRMLPSVEGPMFLPIVAAPLEHAVEDLPENIQTVGYALPGPLSPSWLELLASTRVKRFVPISKMHNFGPVWDGRSFWRECFEEVDLQL
jgi:Acyl-CoA reductase (LuxC)